MLSCIVGIKSINSFDYDEAKLREWSNKEILKCPECGERVIYCKGDYKIPYFKHEIASECVGGSYYEPMTDEHISGIKQLYEMFKGMKGVKNLEVEKYIRNTKQRPDIYFEYNNERYCIEYQCSPISTQYNKRHELYELEGIKDIWILGFENFYIKSIDSLISAAEKNLETHKGDYLESSRKEELEEYIKMKNENLIVFNKKRVKSIEDEINYSDMPLMYYNNKANYIYKTTGVFTINNKNTIMTQTSKVILKIIDIKHVEFQDIITKINSPIDTNENKLKYVLRYRNKDIRVLSEKYNGLNSKYYMYYGTIEQLEYEYQTYYGFNEDIRIEIEDVDIKDILSSIDDFIYNSNKLYDQNKIKVDNYNIIQKYHKLILSVVDKYNHKIKRIKDKKIYIIINLNMSSGKIEILESSGLFKINVFSKYIDFKNKKYDIDEFTMINKLSDIISDEIRRARYDL